MRLIDVNEAARWDWLRSVQTPHVNASDSARNCNFEKSVVWRSTLVAALIVIAINAFQDGPIAPVQAVSHTTV
ncbi:hypothetical protein [Burkholderia plantarii]|uniref:hypothetical protein n=1 Tax=Burkholderia plantarii TaxID=41899 RepID=UPI0018DB4BDA|nr:hypothetical protein [Burkholderia plantarii]MBI0327675.1 hypothetical protein [Burkholderia plantarii]